MESTFTYQTSDLTSLLPKRPKNANKGDFGKVLCIAGSKGMAGSAYLCAKASYYIGAGLVKIYTHESNRIILQTLLPEAIVHTYDTFAQEQIQELLDWSSVVCIGSGLGMSTTSYELMQYVIDQARTPLIIDGDGLHILAHKPELLKVLQSNHVLTPHVKEMSRMIHIDVEMIKSSPFYALQELKQVTNAVIALKDATSLVTQREKATYVNTSGNVCMAKAGSGDVLVGIIAGLIAQQVDAFQATCAAVYLHGLSGDDCQSKYGSYSVMASDLIDGLREITKFDIMVQV